MTSLGSQRSRFLRWQFTAVEENLDGKAILSRYLSTASKCSSFASAAWQEADSLAAKTRLSHTSVICRIPQEGVEKLDFG